MNDVNNVIGSEVGGCQVEEFVESGPEGDIYHATSKGLMVPVTVHIRRENQDPHEFVRIAMASAKVTHPNIRLVHERGADKSGRDYVIVSRCDFRLNDLLMDGIDPLTATGIVRQVNSALDHAHSNDIFHGDISPLSVYFKEGQVKVGSFRNPNGDNSARRLGDVYAVGGFMGAMITGFDSYRSAAWFEQIAGDAAIGGYRSLRELQEDLAKAASLTPSEITLGKKGEIIKRSYLSKLAKMIGIGKK